MAAFAAATGTSPTVASDYLPGNAGWAGMDGSGGSLGWLLGAWSGSGYTLSLGVPIIPTNSSGAAVGTLAQGAAGAFNLYYVTLAQTLVSAGQSNAYLRLGWEFDGSWMPWAATTPTAEANFASYFQQIVTAMRSVPGENFRFVWNPDAGAFTQSGYSVAAAYPGNAYVDVIGLDSYDQSWASPQTPANAWSSTALPSLTAAAAVRLLTRQAAGPDRMGRGHPERRSRARRRSLLHQPDGVVDAQPLQRRGLRDLLRRQQRRSQLAAHRGIVPQSLAAFTAELG